MPQLTKKIVLSSLQNAFFRKQPFAFLFFFPAPSPWHIGMRSKAKVNLHLTCQGVFETAWEKTGRRQAPRCGSAPSTGQEEEVEEEEGTEVLEEAPAVSEDWEEEVRAALEDLAAERSRREVQEFLEEVEQEEQWLVRTRWRHRWTERLPKKRWKLWSL